MFYLWRRMDDEGRASIWRLYGWFSGLIMCGGCVGAVTYLALMQYLVYLFKAYDALKSEDFPRSYMMFAQFYRWRAAYVVTYGMDFLFVVAAKLLVPFPPLTTKLLLRIKHRSCSGT